MLPKGFNILPVQEDEFLFPEDYEGCVPQLRQLGHHKQPGYQSLGQSNAALCIYLYMYIYFIIFCNHIVMSLNFHIFINKYI